MPKILMIAAEFPPCLSAGVQRTYHFAENLLHHDWLPLVLTAHPRVYKKQDEGIKVSDDIKKYVCSAFAADASVHFAIKGKYLGFMENPDKIASWYHHGWRVGMDMIKEHNPDVIWSTFPVSTAHRIGLKLKLKTGRPWVADFRDPLHSHCDDNYKNVTEMAKKIDAETLAHADLIVFATQKMRDLYRNAYPDINADKLCVIENGFDEKVFAALDRGVQTSKQYTLLYSGGLYQVGRDPQPLFHALARLEQERIFNEKEFTLRFRGAGDGLEYYPLISRLKLQNIVEFLPPVNYRQSIQEMKDASALLVLQGKVFDNQIPGKVYEYIATGNPIVGLLGTDGATWDLLKSIPNTYLASENSVDAIVAAVQKLFHYSEKPQIDVAQFSRRVRANTLVEKLNKLIDIA